MSQSGGQSRRRAASMGPVRLKKSDGQFTPENLIKRNLSAIVLGRKDNFTAATCLPAGSLDRPNIRNMSCNYGQCPAGYSSFGYDGTQWNYGSACTMYNMICVKNNYDKTTPSVVADCCNGITAQKDCDPTFCRGSAACRDKMLAICDNSAGFGSARCQTWLNAAENADVKPNILAKYCTGEMMGSGPCRTFASSPAGHGLMDEAVVKWCTPGQIKNPPAVDPLLSDWTKFRMKTGTPPSWATFVYIPSNSPNDGPNGETAKQWDAQMYLTLSQMGGTNGGINEININSVISPPVTYRDNSKDPLCACILSPLNKYGDKAAPPSCFDTSCVSGGYQTGGMKTIATKCPSWVECRSNVQAASGGTNSDVQVRQYCGIPPAGVDVTTQPTPATPTSPATPASQEPLPTYPADDKDKLAADEKLGNSGTGTSTIVPAAVIVAASPSLAERLHKPFIKGMFGDASLASISILFFAIVILSALLWRAMMGRKMPMQNPQTLAEQDAMMLRGRPPEIMDSVIRDEMQSQLSNLPRMTSA